ncbi:MAG: AraC family transcriptional regulator, partial [Crenarchaeota archaeon]|nr:AraC family transcriptional regulator [Thermoproteota archaeon]
MNIEKLYLELEEYIQCEHKNIDYGSLTPFHSHDAYELLLLLDGNVNFYTEGEGLHLNYGNLVCIRPYDFHRREVVSGSNYKRIVIHIRKILLEKLSSEKTNILECFDKVPAGRINLLQFDEDDIVEYSLLAKRLSKELASVEYGSDILAETYLKQILVMVNSNSRNRKDVRVKNIMPPLVADTLAYIEQHITERFSLDDISEYLNYNGTYISRNFKKITGITVQQYIINKRVTIAKKHLNEGYSPC